MSKAGNSANGNLVFNSAVTLAQMIRDKQISSVELTRCFVDRIERLDKKLNAIVVRDFDRAMDAAKTADQALARAEAIGPLHGVPMTIKESFDLAGRATTWGVPDYKDNIASTDAEVVKRFKAA